MVPDADALLAGPRGRRLCLAVAAAAADLDPADDAPPLRAVLLHAAHHLDPGAGTSRAMLWPAGPVVDADLPHPAPAEVAALLDGAALPDLDARALLLALVHAVDQARYWQEPDGEDVLAATPEVRAALRRVAAHVVASPHATWWWGADLARDDQWVVELQPSAPAPPAPAEVTARLDRWRAREVEEEERARRERPRDPRASWSGTWWSAPALAGLTSTTPALGADGPLGLWCVEDALGWGEAVVRRVRVPGGARVHVVDGPAAWAELCRRYPLEVTATRRHDWYRTTGRDGRWCVPDWSRVVRDVDAVHVTVAGYLTTAGRAVPVDGDLATVLAGWDPGRTYWLTDVDDEPGSAQRWQQVLDAAGEPAWHPAGP